MIDSATRIVTRSGRRQTAHSPVRMARTSSAAPTTTAGIAPNCTTPAPHALLGTTASQTHWPALARLIPRSLGMTAHALYALTVTYG